MHTIGLFFLFLLLSAGAGGQELYVFSEPASNMPARTLSPRLKWTGGARPNGSVMQRFTPEFMLGVSPKLMLHAGGTFSNMLTESVRPEGAFVYGKYRFYSKDAVHAHFRLAAFGELGYSRNSMMFDEVTVRGDNSGAEVGLIATQLINKLAVSATGSFLEVFQKNDHVHEPRVERAINYSLSAGYLLLPVVYESYDQLNLNLYMEFLGQQTFGKRTYFIDAAPAVQLIFKSNAKLNLGYRFQLSGNAGRSLERSFLVAFEYLFFDVLKPRRRSAQTQP
jgi:hypothetical protein